MIPFVVDFGGVQINHLKVTKFNGTLELGFRFFA